MEAMTVGCEEYCGGRSGSIRAEPARAREGAIAAAKSGNVGAWLDDTGTETTLRALDDGVEGSEPTRFAPRRNTREKFQERSDLRLTAVDAPEPEVGER